MTSNLPDFLKSRNGKIAAAAAVAVVAVVGAIVLFSGHSAAYKQGYDEGRSGTDMVSQFNKTPREVCAEILGMVQVDHPKIDADDYTHGCLDGMADAGGR